MSVVMNGIIAIFFSAIHCLQPFRRSVTLSRFLRSLALVQSSGRLRRGSTAGATFIALCSGFRLLRIGFF